MLPELAIVKLLLKEEHYLKYFNSIDLSYIRENHRELHALYQELSRLHLKHHKDITLDELSASFISSAQDQSKENKELVGLLIAQVQRCDVDAVVAQDLLESYRRKALLSSAAVAAYEASLGNASEKFFQIVSDLQEVQPVGEELKTQFVTDDLEVLYNETVKIPGLRWRLKSLNQSIGSLRKGDFGFVFARPETGKTTFLASEVTFMASQAKHPILWFNNEEQGTKVMLRCYQAALGLRLEQLLTGVNKHKEAFQKATKGNIKLYDSAIISKSEVEAICAELNPSLIVFDQIDKITGFKADRNDLQLGEIYIWARELSKKYAPVLGICQADGTGEGVKWLTMAHVANAKTSKQAEADWILGIGRQNESGYEYVRHFHVSKNKLLGDEDSIPQMRHGKWDVIICPELARYQDVIT